MGRQTLYLWKQAPFLRLVIPLIAGIAIEWYSGLPAALAWGVLVTALFSLYVFNARFSFLHYRLGFINGLLTNIVFTALGILLCYHAQIRNQAYWLNNYYRQQDIVHASLEEPVSEKPNSYKAIASVKALLRGNAVLPVNGNIIIYFSKGAPAAPLCYGRQFVFSKPLQPVRNSGNPGSFNYERYAQFRGISYQVYLNPEDYALLPLTSANGFTQLLYAARNRLLAIIGKSIAGKKEAGMAEALLLGYRDDLDKGLVQSYSNTGVVHVIAISGMHLGLIYWLLGLATAPLKKLRFTRWAAPVVVIAGLWLFALLTGGGASILRSAVMFSCIVMAESIQRKTVIYNSLAASAFILLCINPFWLWDAGFQLSYTAVLSIVIFMKPVYRCCFFQNKIMDAVWKLTAVTLAAQVLTTPVSMYHFHQFPMYFLFTNLLAVPLSGLIVLLEIVLCAVGTIPAAATATGNIVHWLIAAMNSFIEYMEQLPFSLWTGMQISFVQAALLYGLIAAIACWLLRKYQPAFIVALACLLGFFCLRSYSFIRAAHQQQLVIYNMPRQQAMDFICGRNYFFRADDTMPDVLRGLNTQLAPARILYRTTPAISLNNLVQSHPLWLFNHKTIILADNHFRYQPTIKKIRANLVIISKNASIQPEQLMQMIDCNQLVIDASNSRQKVNKWKTAAAKLGLHCFSVVDNGAFVMNMD